MEYINTIALRNADPTRTAYLSIIDMYVSTRALYCNFYRKSVAYYLKDNDYIINRYGKA